MYVGLSSLGLNTAPFAVSPITSLFQNGEPGAVFIASKPTADWVTNPSLVTMYQDSAGTTPVTALEQPVGLHLDTRPIYKFPGGGTNPAPNTVGQPLRGSEISPVLASGNFNPSGTGASLSTPSAGQITVTNGAAAEANAVIPGVTALAGSYYEIKATLASKVGGGLGFIVAGDTSLALTGNSGSYRNIVKVSTSGTFRIAVGTATINDAVTVSSLSIKQVYGNHRSQSSAGARGMLSARYNKVAARNANPVDLTGVTKGGDAAATLTVVNDAAALTAAGLSGVCALGNVYKLDNTTGVASAQATITGQVTNVNNHVASCWSRITQGAGSLNVSPGGGQALTASSAYVFNTTTKTPGGTASQLQIQANAGAVVFFILPDLREACYSYLPTPQIITGTGSSASDYDDSGFPARIKYSGAQGYATGSVDFTGNQQVQGWTGVTKLSDAAVGIVAEHGNGGSDPLAITFLHAPRGAGTANYGPAITAGGLTNSAFSTTTFASPNSVVASMQADTTQVTITGQLGFRANGASNGTSSGSAVTVNAFFGNYPLFFGSRGGAGVANPITGDEFCTIVRGGTSPGTGTIYSIEQAVGRYMGLNI